MQTRHGFWREALALHGTSIPQVAPLVAIMGLLSTAIVGAARLWEHWFQTEINLNLTPFELAGAALGILLVFRTNAGYERWWEARKLWGGFVDRSRNFVIDALAYGPSNAEWRDRLVRLAAAYPHVVKHTLRGEPLSPAVAALVGQEMAEQISAAGHRPSYVALKLAELLREACECWGMNRFAFLQIDRERALLIDNFGGCERILNTPMPKAYSTKIRHFLLLFLLSLPLTLLHRLHSDWLIPLITMSVAYPLLSLDLLGVELENPFAVDNLSHLPLDGLTATIERNVLDLLQLAPKGIQATVLAPGDDTSGSPRT
jgi:putative membrane protein